MSDETQDKPGLVLSKTAQELLDLIIEEDARHVKSMGASLPPHMREQLSRESAVLFCVTYTFLTFERGVHPTVAASLARSLAGYPPDSVDQTMHEINEAMLAGGDTITESIRGALRMRVFTAKHPPRNDDEPIH